MKSSVVLFCVLGVSVAQTVTIDPVGGVTVADGNNLTITCTDGVYSGYTFGLRENGDLLFGGNTPPNEVNGVVRVFELPVNLTKNGNIYECESLRTGATSPAITLTVTYPPQFFPSNATATPTEGEQFTLFFSIDTNPPPSSDNITLTKSGAPVTDPRVTVTTTSLTIASITRNDSGVYQMTTTNVAGSDTFTLTVDVYYPPEFAVLSQNMTINTTGWENFTFNCTPSDGNPAVYSYTFLKDSVLVTEGVNGSVLTIIPVERSNRGMYTCTTNNTAGTAVVTWNLFVVDVPTMPLNLQVVDLMPYSATFQWDPPSDNGGSSLPLVYIIALTNTSTSLPFSNVTATSLPLTNLQHSTQYSWSVQAMNEYGSSPPAVSNFSTPDSVPIIDSVSAMALSLFAFWVNVTLLTDGGQNVTLYTIEVSGVNYTDIVESSGQNQVLVLINQLDQNFTKGENHTVRMFTTNSVGTSDPLSTLFQVPFPPITTAPPTALSDANIPVCCAGVDLNLANPADPTDVRVFVDGILHPANQVSRYGSFLYIMGLQAGTEYPLNIALLNIFGTVWVNTTVKPLLGRPSTPQVTFSPTDGGLTVQLTVVYPGTRGDTIQYSISTSASLHSRQQTGQQLLPVTNLTIPISGSAEVALGPGTYFVTVTVTNQHASTMSVPQQVTIPGPGSVDTHTAVRTEVAVPVAMTVILVFLLTLSAFITVLVCVKCRRTRSGRGASTYENVNMELKDPHFQFEEVKLETNPAYETVSKPKSTNEPKYEDCGGGVTSIGDVAMEENPAYQSVDAACINKPEESVYQNV